MLGCSEEASTPREDREERHRTVETRLALLGERLADHPGSGLWVPTLPVVLDEEMREAVLVPRGKLLRFREVPRHEDARLEVAVGRPPAGSENTATITVQMHEKGGQDVLLERELSPNAGSWVELEVPLPGSGEGVAPVDLVLKAEGDAVYWSRPIVRSRGRRSERPLGPVSWDEPAEDLLPLLEEASGSDAREVELPGGSTSIRTVPLAPGQRVELPLKDRAGSALRCRFFAVPGARAPSGELVYSVSWLGAGGVRDLGAWRLDAASLDVSELGVRYWTVEARLPGGTGHLVLEIQGEVEGGLHTGVFQLETRRQRSAPRADAGAKPNVLVLLVDTLRADHLGCYGYARDTSPALDRLARQGIRYDRCIAPSSWTLPSIASLFTGEHPPAHGVVDAPGGLRLPAAFETLAERLAARGISTAAFSANFLVDESRGFDQGFERFESLPFAPAEVVHDALLDWLDQIGDRPFFAYVHTFDPHLPYAAPPPWGRQFLPEEAGEAIVLAELLERFHAVAREGALFADRLVVRDEVEGHLRVGEGQIEMSRWLRDRLIDLYDGEIRYWDAQLEALLAELERRGLRERTWLIVTSDHGEAFGEHGYLAHGQTLYDELVRVPLIVVPPGGIAGRVEQRPVELIDLGATILEQLGLEPSESGRAVPLPLGEEDRPRRMVAFSHVAARVRPDGEEEIRYVELTSIAGERWKSILRWEDERQELYDLAADPGERVDRSEESTQRAAELRRALDRWRQITPRRTAASPATDPDTERALRRMGYFGR